MWSTPRQLATGTPPNEESGPLAEVTTLTVLAMFCSLTFFCPSVCGVVAKFGDVRRTTAVIAHQAISAQASCGF